MSRTIFTGALTLGLALAVGCGSKSEQPLPSVPADPGPTVSIPAPGDAPPAPPAGAPPKVEPPKVDWELDVEKHVVPATPVKGRIAGVDVTPEVLLEGADLTFCTYKVGTPKDEQPVIERLVKLKLAPMLVAGQQAPKVTGRQWKMKVDTQPGADVPQIWREAIGKGTFVYPPACAVTLDLGERKGGKVPGKIYLSLDDPEKTFLAGTFEATYVRPPSELPGPDDAPYVGGTINVVAPKPGAELRIGYAAFTETGGSFPEFSIPYTSPPELPSQSAKVGTTTFVPGDGKTRPFRYEHVKLAPGRYLITVAVAGGPTVWKWVDVAPVTAMTENFTLDASAAGGVEVAVPAGVTGMVLVAPADDPNRPALDPSAFQLLAILVSRQGANIVGGKALVKNLSPGKYEVRAGELRGFVDVAAGKTAELTLNAPKKP